MFFTASNVVHYLSARGLINTSKLVDGDFFVVEAGQRNRNFKVIQSSARSIFVKQVSSTDHASLATMRREVEWYSNMQLQNDLKLPMPAMIASDTVRHCLLLELIPDALNLTEYLQHYGHFPESLGDSLGSALAQLHQASHLAVLANLCDQHGAISLPKKKPWIFSMREISPTATGGVRKLIEFLNERPDLLANLDRLRDAWQIDAIMHGDMKWDNCVLYADENETLQIKIIDWELVDAGDASWDIAGILQSFVTHAILSIPENQDVKSTDFLHEDRLLSQAMLTVIGQFWSGYLRNIGAENVAIPDYFLRCVEFTAARLILTAFGFLCYSEVMTSHAQIMLVLSQQMLNEPKCAAIRLFGWREDFPS
jgi:aminoglycoside phosphotransferase (APT) family kinase protein